MSCVKEEEIVDVNYRDIKTIKYYNIIIFMKLVSTKGILSETNYLKCKERFKEYSKKRIITYNIYIFYNQYQCCDIVLFLILI